jgi:ketosteroid isomerase-like protein
MRVTRDKFGFSMCPHKLSRIANLHALIGSAAVCFCIAAWVPAEEPPKNGTAADELMELEKVWNQAHLRGDAAALDQLWADDFEVIVPKMAEMKKSDVLAFVRSGRMKFQTYETSGIQMRMYGDTAIVTGRMKRVRTLQEQSITDNWQFSKIYRRKDGRWQVIQFQASDAPST